MGLDLATLFVGVLGGLLGSLMFFVACMVVLYRIGKRRADKKREERLTEKQEMDDLLRGNGPRSRGA